MKNSHLQLSSKRLFNRLDELARIGTTPQGGVRRLALSDEDKCARDLVLKWMGDLDMEIQVDRIGNIIGIRPGAEDLAPVMTGSHIDTVINGGNLDGNLGVLAGLEIIETLNDASAETRRPVAVGVFTNEEGARFQPDMMGSLVYAGGMELDEALLATDNNGLALGQELSRIGYSGSIDPGSIVPHAFIELHIEQGPILEQENITIGAVENLQGISWTEITISGQANHAGTTPMHLRNDAGYCAAAITTFVRDMAREIGSGQVATVGTIELKPNVINVVPGTARLTVDLRNADNSQLTHAESLLDDFLGQLSGSEGVNIDTTRLVRFDPVIFDNTIAERIESNAAMLNYSNRRMTSGAGHDAQMMSRLCPTAMIFIPSINGVSHNPAEATDESDVLAGANVLLHTLLDLTDS